jgi:hypothetical protein
MKARSLYAIALTGLCAAMSLPARAAEFHAIYDGTITGGSDVDNIFGLLGQSLVGLGLRADVIYSTGIAGTRTTNTTFDEISGGENFGTAPVISSAVFTIGSASFSFSPTYYGDVYTSAGYLDAYGLDLLGNNFQTYIVPDQAGPRNLETPFASTGTGDAGGASTQFSFLIAGNDDIDFNPISVSVSAVPEATTWTMMLVGFGAMGYALRRRSKVRAVPSST